MKARWRLLVTLLLLVPCSALGIEGQMGGAFLRMEPDARSLAMGSLQTPLSEGPSALFGNPSGLETAEGRLRAMFSIRAAGPLDSWRSAAVSYRVFLRSRKGHVTRLATVALGYQGLAVNGIRGYDAQDRFQGTFGSNQYAFHFGFGRSEVPLGAGIMSWGIAAKYVHVGIGADRAQAGEGIGGDIGMGWSQGTKSGLAVAAVFHTAIELRWSAQYQDHVPKVFKMGACYYITRPMAIGVGIDAEQIERAPLLVHVGAEVQPVEILTLRLGLANLQFENRSTGVSSTDLMKSDLRFCGGVGLHIEKTGSGNVELDYGFSTHPYLDGTHMVTVLIGM